MKTFTELNADLDADLDAFNATLSEDNEDTPTNTDEEKSSPRRTNR
jgi:hypothetical protein